MENQKIDLKGLKRLNIIIADKSPDGKHANIIVSIFDLFKKKEVLKTFTGCEVLSDGRFRKDISARNIGLKYLYF